MKKHELTYSIKWLQKNLLSMPIFLGLLTFFCLGESNLLADESLEVSYRHDQKVDILGRFSVQDIKKKKASQFSERLPGQTQSAVFKGTSLSNLIEEWAKLLPPEKRANIDLIVLKAKDDQRTLIPRWFFVRYPSFLVYARQGEDDLEKEARPFRTVISWSSRPQMKSEDLPLESYFLSRVTSIELTNYKENYKWAFLEKKTEPAVLKGQRLFVQNCLACHAPIQNPIQQLSAVFDSQELKALEDRAHPSQGSFKFNASQVRAIQLYGQAQSKQQEGRATP